MVYANRDSIFGGELASYTEGFLIQILIDPHINNIRWKIGHHYHLYSYRWGILWCISTVIYVLMIIIKPVNNIAYRDN